MTSGQDQCPPLSESGVAVQNLRSLVSYSQKRVSKDSHGTEIGSELVRKRQYDRDRSVLKHDSEASHVSC